MDVIPNAWIKDKPCYQKRPQMASFKIFDEFSTYLAALCVHILFLLMNKETIEVVGHFNSLCPSGDITM